MLLAIDAGNTNIVFAVHGYGAVACIREAFVVAESKDLARICSTISDRMHNQYTFGYYPARQQNQEWRTIRVEAKIPGLRVVASKAGYFPAVEADDRPQ